MHHHSDAILKLLFFHSAQIVKHKHIYFLHTTILCTLNQTTN